MVATWELNATGFSSLKNVAYIREFTIQMQIARPFYFEPGNWKLFPFLSVSVMGVPGLRLYCL